jgi:SAM-dependent methyltransferase
MPYPERIIPDETPAGILALHLKRYALVTELAAGRSVLDAACGAGYGAAYLAEVADEVLGVDVDEQTIEYARMRYAGPRVSFEVMDVTALDLADNSFDVVCSFETIEHVVDGAAAVREAARVLRPEGVYAVSTPKAEQTTDQPDNPFHAVEYAVDDFRAMLESSFGEVELYGQSRVATRAHRLLRRLDVLGLRRRIPLTWTAHVTGSRATADLTLDDVAIGPDLDGATEIVAVCRAPRKA